MSDVTRQKSPVANEKSESNQVWQKRVMKEPAGAGRINSAKDLAVYKAAYELAMNIFELSKRFPAEEKFALTSQIRRSSRSVCLNLREAWAKRRYEAHFISKLTDSDGENSETDSSLDFARDCKCICADEHRTLTSKCAEIGRMLSGMMKKSDSFLSRE
jgi:four helix bundle protein